MIKNHTKRSAKRSKNDLERNAAIFMYTIFCLKKPLMIIEQKVRKVEMSKN